MKLKKFFLMLIISLVFVTGCEKKLSTYDEISYNKLIEKLDSKESFILYIGSASCSHCALFKGTINSVIKNYQVKVSYIDISKLTKTELNLLSSRIQYSGTPTVAFVEKGQASSALNKRIVGDVEYDKVVKKMQTNGYIEK